MFIEDISWLHALHVAHHGNLGQVRRLVRGGSTQAAVRRLGLGGLRRTAEWRKLGRLASTEGLWLLAAGEGLFPELLSESPDAPLLLYGRGDPQVLSAAPLVTLVGSRNCSRYGQQVVDELVPELVGAGCVTVSGLAYGIDAAVHRATLAAGGRTIAVLGGAVTDAEIAPRAHVELASEILKGGGAVVAEYPPGTVTYPALYPERNRIVAGLSLATVVVEGAAKSGSLITARLAVEAGRSVLAVPGSIFAHTSAGTNQLIATGATPLLSCQSVFDEIAFELNSLKIDPLPHVVAKSSSATSTDSAVLSCCSSSKSIDQIIETVELPAPVVLKAVTALTLSGQLESQPGGLYRKVPDRIS